jgi:hypothetical protein
VDLVAAAAGDVAERVREVGLADPDLAEDEHPAGVVDEPQRGQLGPQRLVVGDGGVGIPGLQGHGRVELGGFGAQRGGLAVAAVDLVGEEQFEELGVLELVLFGEGEPFGEGVDGLAELDC